MPERVYMNRLPGEERIHIAISRAEIREMLAQPAGPAARQFWELLATADHQFGGTDQPPPPVVCTSYVGGHIHCDRCGGALDDHDAEEPAP